MTRYGLLVDYEFCFGCFACEVACQTEHDLPLGQWGIKVQQLGPWQTDSSKTGKDGWVYDNIPLLTKLCNLCEERTAQGKLPSCVHHCMAQCLKYGPVEDLSKDFERKPYQALLVPQCA